MIKGEHLFNEIEEIKKVSKELDNEGKTFEAKLLLAQTLQLKLLLNIRQNQVATIPKEKLVQPKRKDGETSQTE